MSLENYYKFKNGCEKIFSVESSKVKFGRGALEEVGNDARSLGMNRVAIFTDKMVVKLPPVSKVIDSIKAIGLDFSIFDQVTVEPTDLSFKLGS